MNTSWRRIPAAIVAHTNRAIDLEDETVVRLTRDSFRTATVENVPVTAKLMELEVNLEQIELGEYEHYMLKEIHEQPQAIRRCCKGRVDEAAGRVVLGGIADFASELQKARRIVFLGQGTALHSGMVGEYIMEDLAKIPTEVDYASEFRYRNPIVEDDTVVVAISQSGETIDTLNATRESHQRGALTLGLVNVVGSTIAKGDRCRRVPAGRSGDRGRLHQGVRRSVGGNHAVGDFAGAIQVPVRRHDAGVAVAVDGDAGSHPAGH